jgi:hypothetical protein
MLIILTTFYFIETLRRKRLKIDGKAKFAFNISEGKAIALLAILWIWAESIESAGFIISTMFLLAGTAYLYGERSFIKICRLSIIAPLLSYVFFTLLKSTLPAGYLETWLLNMIR